MKRLHNAFTLIELLVVMAVISILSAILFPVFSIAREQARQTMCASNMHQVGLALRMYLGDYDDVWMPAFSVGRPNAGFNWQEPWIGYDNKNAPNGGDITLPAKNPAHPGLIDPYIKNEGVKRCPSMPTSWQTAFGLNAFSTEVPSAYYTTHPAAQGNEFGPSCKSQTFDPSTYLPVAIAAGDGEVQQPAETLVLWEHANPLDLCNFLQPPDWFTSPPAGAFRDHFHLLHRDGATTLWADGHVKHLIYDRLRRPWFSCRKDIYPDLP